MRPRPLTQRKIDQPVQSELISVDGSKTDITNKQVLTSFVKG
jgi:hypothetical protein